MLYIFQNKSTKEPKGTVNIANKEVLKDWKKRYTLTEAGDEFYRKQGYEMKFENGKVRLATQAEIDAYLQDEQDQINADEKARILSVIGLTQGDIDKIKALP